MFADGRFESVPGDVSHLAKKEKKKKREETINAIKSLLYSKSKAVCLKVQDLINCSF